ncbi:MAG TPA: secondary thiamine-phosphate synthase enzyme YjbQ [Dehalococcoidia bacterium]|jgi:secondary thiamine-phosphate synthase enzyme
MTVVSKTIRVNTRGHCDMIDITGHVAKEISVSEIKNGLATIFITGSTAGITTIEYEGGVLSDYKAMWERNVPSTIPYQHDQRWGDGNGYSHVRASLQGPSMVIPFVNKKMMLGTWQQIVIVDFDNRARSREIVLQILGE